VKLAFGSSVLFMGTHKKFGLFTSLLIVVSLQAASVGAVTFESLIDNAAVASSAFPIGVKQRILSQKFSGGCTQNRGYPGQIVMEEKYDPTCRVTVSLSGTTARTVSLQWWSEDSSKWVEESRKKTSKGKAVISFKAWNCGDLNEEYCDGTYEYRIYVLPSTKPKLTAIKSTSFDVLFISLSGGTDDEYDCDPDYEDC